MIIVPKGIQLQKILLENRLHPLAMPELPWYPLLSSMIHPLTSKQGLHVTDAEEVSMTISSIYSCTPEGPLENSFITKV